MKIEKYSIEWFNSLGTDYTFNQYWDLTNFPPEKERDMTSYDFYNELKELVYKRHKLIEPPCGCYGKRLYNKLKNKTAIKSYEDQIQILTSGTTY